MAGPQGRDPRRCSARGHMIMCGESAARASRVPSPVQACTGRRVAVVGACRGVAPFEFRVYRGSSLYIHALMLTGISYAKGDEGNYIFSHTHSPQSMRLTWRRSSHAVETARADSGRLPGSPVPRSSVAVTVQGGCCLLFGPSVRSPLRCPLWPLWLTPWCQVSSLCRRGAVFAFAGPLILHVPPHLEFAEQVTDPCGHSSCPRAPLLNSLTKWQLSERGGYAW